MVNLLARLVVGLSGACVSLTLHAAEATLNLCTAGPESAYLEIGRAIAAHANPRYLVVKPVETAGSLDNMNRMSRGECGAAIAQVDAYLVYQKEHKDRPLEVTRNRFLYAEFIHLVCRRDARVSSTADLLASPGRYEILVGAEESGSAVTWHAFTLLDHRYRELKATHIGGQDALDRVLNSDSQCLFYISALGSKFAESVNHRGKDLRLIPITEAAFRAAKIGTTALYEIRRFPRGVYPNLDAGMSDGGIETLTVAAGLAIDRRWSDRYPNGQPALFGAVAGAAPTIEQRATAGKNK